MASSSKKLTLGKVKDFVRETNLEDQFLKLVGIDSLDELSPLNFEDPSPPQAPTTSVPTISAALQPAKKQDKSDADARTGIKPTVASDVLYPFIRTQIVYAPKMKPSSYTPFSLMMDYIVHLMNFYLVDNFYFKRATPDYHPYILRLYFAVVFWIQCMRAANDTKCLDSTYHQFLIRFLDCHPVESLPIPGPLLPLFKAICSSKPEDPLYGKVFPHLPAAPGPEKRESFIDDVSASFVRPNVPGVFALLEHLNGLINANVPSYPKKGKHIPVTADAVQAQVFGHHSFPVPANRTNLEKWSLVTSGIQYPCEADARLNEAFAERYNDFDFPTTAADDDLTNIESFLGMDFSMAWFSQVKSVAASAANFYEGSGTLADCSPSGIVSNQIIVRYQAPVTLPTAPTQVADKKSLFPFSFRLSTSMRSPPPLSEAMAAYSQVNAQIFATHPAMANLGRADRYGDFWDISPEHHSQRDESSYLALGDIIKKMMKSKV